jgi:CHAT domain-containing protein
MNRIITKKSVSKNSYSVIPACRESFFEEGLRISRNDKLCGFTNGFISKILFLSCLFSIMFMAFAANSSGQSRADALIGEMLQALQRGDFKQAILSGNETELLYREDGNTAGQIRALVHLSGAYQSIGKYRTGLEKLKAALELAGRKGLESQMPMVLSKLGNAYILINQLGDAETHLKESISLSAKENNIEVQSSALNYLGNLYSIRNMHNEALSSYKESAMLSEKTQDRLLSARILANTARALSHIGNREESERALEAAYKTHIALGDSHEKAFGLINIGLTYLKIGRTLPAQKALKEAAAVAENINDHLSASYAFGYLGHIYERSGSYQSALNNTRRAIFEAQQVNSPESLYRWQWQSGRLFKADGKTDKALSLYKSAAKTLQSIRYELLSDCMIYNHLVFQESLEPVYFEMADLLLMHADSIKDEKLRQPYLKEARETVELLKTAELQDYFQDACVVADKLKIKTLESIAPNSAVVYVIPLPDRLELLLGIGDEIRRFTAKVSSDSFTKEIRAFRKKLEKRTTRQYLPHAQTLYDWIIRPLESELSSGKIETLVFVPHGPLYTVPMSALHDGKDFLISKFSVAVTPGLSLSDPRHLSREKIDVLLAGITESVHGFPALINVPLELNSIQGLYANKLLQDQDFRIPLMKVELEHKPYSIVHIASHGEFFENSRDTYLLAWDEKLNMNHLEKFMGIGKFRREPVELLTLSACVTAAGSDRAALGLAGVAVKSGARSALATLWYINDHTSYELIKEFYGQLKDPHISNAEALRKAQLKLLHNRNFRHPGYWSPFLLIGNWL